MNMTRRLILASSVAAALGSDTSAAGAAETISSETDAAFLADLHAWRRAYDAAAAEPECDLLWDAKCAIADRIMNRPADSAVGFAVKLLVLTEYGDHDLQGEYQEAVLDDAERMIGVPMPEAMAAWQAKHQEGGAA